MLQTNYRLTRPQNRFFNATEPFVAFVGGFGSGKTSTAAFKLLALKFAYPKVDLLYSAPTYPLIRDIFYPTVNELLEGTCWEDRYKVKASKNVVDFGKYGKILCRTLHPDKLIGFKVGAAVADEIDVLSMREATACWNKIIARVRQPFPDGRSGQVMATTTPEGFKFTYEFFGRFKYKNRLLVQAPSTSNPHLPKEYIENLRSAYPEELVNAYINGIFVNLVSGSVYTFNRAIHGCDEEAAPGEHLHVGMDFNVSKMATVIHVIRDDHAIAVDEIMGCADTPAAIIALKERYPRHTITVYPDASGSSRDSRDASRSDITLLTQAGFGISAPRANPLIRDRVLAINIALKERRYWVNTRKCPHLTECLEQQVYTEAGVPDKSQGKDHAPDATGYFMHRKFPVKKNVIHTQAVSF